ncbi:hypothetical protein L829_1063 [Mycobacteroides abscessus MAB_030201_1075]|uniref:Uncharacterized protein n=1 Tax=Mycobacteroides abscessus MAB_030201_1075 TaxID=1335410 RepID=A0A829PL44_9MYCO|nr:hypothetical protein L835_3081 [Mycobacteroides abscessus MAB_110811_1470]ETZ87516.1 hypothetical protein L829_1063 [Mycobacteroides abscessus MAB_030201_1075]ETZ93408.1 hypothetical protein L828_3146 [Mycobacteroides abscessus MAB_030201_1061]CPW61615.1 Uncharacterised protein [Mycobacteroides abscessus]SKF25869.1 Uncharacterised protein [Mycobacteroides abscessus subsp. bolletii]
MGGSGKNDVVVAELRNENGSPAGLRHAELFCTEDTYSCAVSATLENNFECLPNGKYGRYLL